MEPIPATEFFFSFDAPSKYGKSFLWSCILMQSCRPRFSQTTFQILLCHRGYYHASSIGPVLPFTNKMTQLPSQAQLAYSFNPETYQVS